MTDAPSDRPDPKRTISPERQALTNIALAYQAAAVELVEYSKGFDDLAPDARRVAGHVISEQLGHLGDHAHVTRRALRAMLGL